MPIINCTECQKEVSDQAKACPHCGATLKKSGTWKYFVYVPLGLFAALMLIGTMSGNSPQDKSKQSDRLAIEYCWKEQSRKSLDPASARFAAGACEMMERDFQTKFGHKP